jgi:error-prone DNA polymerase
LAYQSAWLRHHDPAEFLCALLNAQPMGFYPPASLVRDAQRRGVEVRPTDVNRSTAGATMEDGAVRLGLAQVQSLGEDEAKALVAERERGGAYAGVVDLAQRAPVTQRSLEALVSSDACACFGEARRELRWQLGLVPRSQSVPGTGGEERQLALPLDPTTETPVLPRPSEWERMLADYRATRVSLDLHPLGLLRPHLPARVRRSSELGTAPRGEVAVAGLVVARQRPSTANGVVFVLLEDELGQMNLIVPPPVYDQFRALVRGEALLLARGRLERRDRNVNVVVRALESLAPLARRLSGEPHSLALPGSKDFG